MRLTHDEASNSVDLTVRDSGVGIPREQLTKIFDRFYSTKDGPDETGKGGTGVGLSTCKDIVDAHHGKFRVESTVGKGTAFTVRLPVFKQPQVGATAVPIAKLGVPAQVARVAD